MSIVYEKSFLAFLFVTVLLGGGAAFMIGQATAKGWKPFWQTLFYVMLLAAAIRFLHWGLFAGATLESWRQAQGTLFSLHYYFADAAVLLVFAGIGFRLKRISQQRHQYGWLLRKSGRHA